MRLDPERREPFPVQMSRFGDENSADAAIPQGVAGTQGHGLSRLADGTEPDRAADRTRSERPAHRRAPTDHLQCDGKETQDLSA